MTGRALEAVLDQLHGLAADALLTELRQHMERLAENPERQARYEEAYARWQANPDADPKSAPKEPEPYQVPPQFLDKVLKYLTNNGVTAPATAPKVDALARTLADLDLDAETRPQH